MNRFFVGLVVGLVFGCLVCLLSFRYQFVSATSQGLVIGSRLDRITGATAVAVATPAGIEWRAVKDRNQATIDFRPEALGDIPVPISEDPQKVTQPLAAH